MLKLVHALRGWPIRVAQGEEVVSVIITAFCDAINLIGSVCGLASERAVSTRVHTPEPCL